MEPAGRTAPAAVRCARSPAGPTPAPARRTRPLLDAALAGERVQVPADGGGGGAGLGGGRRPGLRALLEQQPRDAGARAPVVGNRRRPDSRALFHNTSVPYFGERATAGSAAGPPAG